MCKTKLQCINCFVHATFSLLLTYHRHLRMISEALELYLEGGQVSHQLVHVCSWSWLWVGMEMVDGRDALPECKVIH